MEEEARNRFPLANSPKTPSKTRAIRGSVFMPVDNMARYWFGGFQETGDPVCLGYVLHAIQDASIPQHAAGYLGNWHGKWEDKLSGKLTDEWLAAPDFLTEAAQLFDEWNKCDPAPPAALSRSDAWKTPARNWRIDMLVTWLAIQAYNVYGGPCGSFADGWVWKETEAKSLTIQALAMSMLALSAATGTLAPHGVTMRPRSLEDTAIWILQ